MLSTGLPGFLDRKSTRLNSSYVEISYAVFCLKKKIAENMKNRLISKTQRRIRAEHEHSMPDRGEHQSDVREDVVEVAHVRLVFFFNDTATTEIYTLSLHDALPI